MTPRLETLLAAAVRAASGDNTQPWRFAVDPAAGRIALRLDPTRDPSPMNAGQRMARIAVGAALENLLRTAAANGWPAALEPAAPPDLAAVRLADPAGDPGRIEDVLARRVTNRRPYDARPVPADLLARLAAATPELDGVTTHWITDRPRLAALAELIGRCDAVMFGEPTMRRAFLSKVRFDRPDAEEVEEGLPLASLEVAGADRFALRLMPRLPGWLLKATGGLRVFAKKARQLVESASGLCLVVAPDDRPETDLAVGRAMQRAWLALTAEGLAAQPMMSLPVLENALANGPPELVASLGRERVRGLGEEFRKLAPEVGGGRPGYLMRFGWAAPPSGRTGRLPPRAVTDESAAAG